ncbi:MAG TPA: hypothetical protein VFG30_25420 [Polyangiales bacterium]|jgi:hypothetical protein|nr:hypothetical protein [Polyangiales bacterium]
MGDDRTGLASTGRTPENPPGGVTGVRIRLPNLETFLGLAGNALAAQAVRLSENQVNLARPIFESSIDYARVRIVSAAIGNSPTTLGNYIRVDPRQTLADYTLIHELTHIWQFQTRGTSYISNSFCAQAVAAILEGDRNAAYRLTKSQLGAAPSIYALSAEQQAVFVQRYFALEGMRQDPKWKQFIGEVRASRPLPASTFQEQAVGIPVKGHFEESSSPSVMPWLRIEF